MIKNLESIKQKIEIIQVLSHYLPLKKDGVNWSCCCPFHSEKSGSFMVSPKKQFYHCFGCGVSGDAIKFVQEYRKCNFEEAIREIAGLLNVEVQDGYCADLKEYYNALETLNKCFKETLKAQEKPLNYLFNRGLSQEDLETYDIGYIPKRAEIPNKAFLKELGYLYENGDFSNAHRLSFALRDTRGRVVGFSCRTHPYENFRNSAKYINSKESKLFHKSQLLYNLFRAKKEIQEKKEVLITEGFMDTIALDKMGVKNCIATAGTAFNSTHLSGILRIREELTLCFCFDKDSAGELATFRALNLCFKNKIFNVKVLELENNGKDIGEVLQNKEELKLKEYKGFEWYLKKKKQSAKTQQEKSALLNHIKAILQSIENYYLKEELTASAQEILEIPREAFRAKKVFVTKSANVSLLEMQFFKSIFHNADCFYLAERYILGEELILKQDYLEFLKTKTLSTKLQEIELSAITPLKYEEFKACCVALLMAYARGRIARAKAHRNTQELIMYSAQLDNLKQGLLY